MPEEDLVDIKFRLYDGSDIGPFRYSSAATVDMLKQRIVSDWPKGLSLFTYLHIDFNYSSSQLFCYFCLRIPLVLILIS